MTANVNRQRPQGKAPDDAELAPSEDGLTHQVTQMESPVTMDRLHNRIELERAREPSAEAQWAALRAPIEQVRALLRRARKRSTGFRDMAQTTSLLQPFRARDCAVLWARDVARWL